MRPPCTKLRVLTLPAILLAVVTAWETLVAAPPMPRRAKRPEFPASTVETFFPDAREKLQGERPGPRTASEPPSPSAAPPVAAPNTAGWSKRISAETLEDEIKARLPKLASAVENPTRFKSGDYQAARRELGVLAAMLGIVAEYDGRVRWKAEAGALRDQLSRASSNCKVASDAALAEARARAEDLQLLVRGGGQPKAAPSGAADRLQLVDRTLLMQRLEEALEQTVRPSLGNEKVFQSAAAEMQHEAEVVAALSDLIERSGYEFADDETYLGYARAMGRQATALKAATLENSYDKARASGAELGQSCTACHEGYRS